MKKTCDGKRETGVHIFQVMKNEVREQVQRHRQKRRPRHKQDRIIYQFSVGKIGVRGDMDCPNNWSKVPSSAACSAVEVDGSNGLENTGEPKGTNSKSSEE